MVEVGTELTKKLTVVNMLGKLVVEQHFSDEKSTRVKVSIEWQAKATTDEEDDSGDRCDLPRGL